MKIFNLKGDDWDDPGLPLEYTESARLLHAFYDPFPTVEHFSHVETRVTGA